MLICSIDFILSFLNVLIIFKHLFHVNCYNTMMVIILSLLPIFFIKIYNFKRGHLISKFHVIYTPNYFDSVLRPAFWSLWRSSFDHERQSGHNPTNAQSVFISSNFTTQNFLYMNLQTLLLRFNSSKIHFLKI